MNRIEEILERHYCLEQPPGTDIISAMKEYAEFYAKKCLKIAADNADIHPMRAFNQVDKSTILDIKLPEHL